MTVYTTEWADVLGVLLIVILLPFTVYLLVRLGSLAYYNSKLEFLSRQLRRIHKSKVKENTDGT